MRIFLSKFTLPLLLGIVLFLLAPLPLEAAKTDAEPSILLDKPAPLLSGRGLISPKLINLKKLRSKVVYAKGPDGKLLKGEDGKLKKKVTKYVQVLNFFATYCLPCVKEIPTFNTLAESYGEKAVRFFYINVDVEKTRQEVARFAKAKGIAVEMMFPSVKYAMKAYDIDALPRIVVIDGDGVVRKVIRGFHEDLAAQMDAVIAEVLPGS